MVKLAIEVPSWLRWLGMPVNFNENAIVEHPKDHIVEVARHRELYEVDDDGWVPMFAVGDHVARKLAPLDTLVVVNVWPGKKLYRCEYAGSTVRRLMDIPEVELKMV